MNHRRMIALSMYQALRRNDAVRVRCAVRSKTGPAVGISLDQPNRARRSARVPALARTVKRERGGRESDGAANQNPRLRTQSALANISWHAVLGRGESYNGH